MAKSVQKQEQQHNPLNTAGMPIHPGLDWPKNITQKCRETGETTKFLEYSGKFYFEEILKLTQDFNPSHFCWEKTGLKEKNLFWEVVWKKDGITGFGKQIGLSEKVKTKRDCESENRKWKGRSHRQMGLTVKVKR